MVGLHQAMNKREITELERAMAFVREHGYHADLEKEMASAGHLLGRLKRLERIRHEILELKQSTVAEIRSYTNPPPVVHSVMTAVFLLLGHKEKETKVGLTLFVLSHSLPVLCMSSCARTTSSFCRTGAILPL